MRTAFALVLVLLLGLGGWLALHGGGEAPALPTTPELERSHGTTAEAAVAVADTPTVERTIADAASSGPASEAPPIPDDATWLELTVVDGETKLPLAGADVWWWNEQQWKLLQALPREEAAAMQRDEDARLMRFGWHARSDADGRVRVTPGANGATVHARTERHFGIGYFSDQQPVPDSGHQLELLVDRTLTVHVRDAGGADAQGVPVELAPCDPAGGDGPQFQGLHRRESDARGIVRFPHVQMQATWPWGERQGEPVARFAVSIVSPGSSHEPVLLDPRALPDDPVELRLDATGHVAVRIVFEGQPIPTLRDLLLHAGPRGDSGALNAAWQQPVDREGNARFRHVPLGKTFVVGSHFWSRELPGPTAPGQEVRHVLDIQEFVYALSGRLLDEGGQPIADTSVQTRFDLITSMGGGQVGTDAAGRFLWIVTEVRGQQSQAEIRHLSFELGRTEGTSTTPRRVAVAPRPLHAGRNDLGDLRLGVDALVVGGRLVFDCGQRRGTGLEVERHQPSSRPGREGSWRRVDGLQAVVHEDARFEVRGTVEPGRYRLKLQAFDHLPVEPVEFAPGTTNLEVAVRCGSRLEVTCLLPERLEPRLVWLELVPQTAETATDDRLHDRRLRGEAGWRSGADVPARYTWQAVPEGAYTLRITASGAPIAAIEGLELPLRGDVDPRLVDIDLRTRVAPLKLTMRTPKDDATRNTVVVFAEPQADDRSWRGAQVWQGRGTIAVPTGPVDLLVALDGHQPARLRGVEHEAEATLAPWPTVAMTLAGYDTLPPDAELFVDADAHGASQHAERRFETDNRSGGLEWLIEPPRGSEQVVDHAATLHVGEGTSPLRVRLRVGRRSHALGQVTPAEVVAGHPATILLSAEEIVRVAEQLRGQGK